MKFTSNKILALDKKKVQLKLKIKINYHFKVQVTYRTIPQETSQERS